MKIRRDTKFLLATISIVIIICGLIAFAIYITKSGVPLWGLLVLGGARYHWKDTCPQCGYKFPEDEDNEDGDNE